jgi:hypothetical protein
MATKFQPLGKVANMVETMGLEVTYAYEDLAFIQHNAFLIQFTDDDSKLLVHFNEECPVGDRADLTTILSGRAGELNLTLTFSGTFSMNQNENDEIDIKFQPGS